MNKNSELEVLRFVQKQMHGEIRVTDFGYSEFTQVERKSITRLIRCGDLKRFKLFGGMGATITSAGHERLQILTIAASRPHITRYVGR